MNIWTEKKETPKAKEPENKGKLIRDENGQWVLIKKEKKDETSDQIKKVTNLDSHVIANVIAQSSIRLAQAGIQTSRLDAELLLMYVLGKTKEELIKNWTKKLDDAAFDKYQELLDRRLKREPLAYIVGFKSFYHNNFVVDKRVLVPRPETEILVEQALSIIKKWSDSSEQIALVDVGTGCGNIALSVAKEVSFVKIFGTDISPDAIEVAKINANVLSLEQNVAFLHGDLLTPLPQPVNIIVANLPYISESKYETLAPEIKQYEPRSALIAGSDGLDLYRRLLAQVPQFLLQNGKMILEIDPEQVQAMRTMILESLPQAEISVIQDGQHLDRVILVEL